jgi:hypothetical protein
MALPKIKIPLFDVTIPSTKKDAKFRPFLVKEEKILLIAQSGGSKREMVNSLKQVINNCVTMLDGTDVDVDALTTFDLEYIFLKIRSKSVENVVKLKYLDHEDEKEYEFEVRLDDIAIKYTPDHSNKVKINDDIGIVLRYPTASIINTFDKEEDEDLSETEISIAMVKHCIDKIYDKEQVYLVSECAPGELDEFIDSMNVKAFEGIQKFFESMPTMYHKIEYTNSKGTARVIELTTLDDFFTLA